MQTTKPTQVENVNVERHEVLITPEQLKKELPLTESVREKVTEHRQCIADIVQHKDQRMLVVVGPCSIHDPKAALDYGRRLKVLSSQVQDKLVLVMRTYFEKPRTTVGWKGLINDPYLDDSFQVAHGLKIARKLLLDLAEMGLPLATEALDPISPQYLQDLISWSAIGARTTESQTHREIASGLSCAVGFKNGTDGSLDVALNALRSAQSPHSFLGISPAGQVSVVHTKGNEAVHLVMRGGNKGPNYSPDHITAAEQALLAIQKQPAIMVDCSHANSEKDHNKQSHVLETITQMKEQGNRSIIGLMLESNLHPGRQDIGNSPLEYGVSITDACIDWQTTERGLLSLYETL